jgi:hypothetical protein
MLKANPPSPSQDLAPQHNGHGGWKLQEESLYLLVDVNIMTATKVYKPNWCHDKSLYPYLSSASCA